MGQDDCLKLLKKKGTWIPGLKIAKLLDLSPGGVNISLRKLLKEGVIIRRIDPNQRRGFEWHISLI